MIARHLVRIATLGLLMGFLGAACTVGPGSTPAPGSETSPPPSATAPSGTCPNFVTVVETGPLPTNMSEDHPIVQEQGRIQDDIQAASEYGAAHPDDFGSIRIENVPRVRIVIGFSGNIDVHCDALRAILAYPDEFEIVGQLITRIALEDLQAQMPALAGERLRGVGGLADTLEVTLRADGEALAEELHSKYGDLLTIRVGFQGYPLADADAIDCSSWLQGDVVTNPSLAVTFELDQATVRSGTDFSGTATVTNVGPTTVDFESGQPMTARVYRSGTNELVATYDGGVAGTGLGRSLAPGESVEIRVLGGTASCLAELGYALPPGTYDVRAPIDQYERRPGVDGVIATYLLSDPVTLTVVP